MNNTKNNLQTMAVISGLAPKYDFYDKDLLFRLHAAELVSQLAEEARPNLYTHRHRFWRQDCTNFLINRNRNPLKWLRFTVLLKRALEKRSSLVKLCLDVTKEVHMEIVTLNAERFLAEDYLLHNLHLPLCFQESHNLLILCMPFVEILDWLGVRFDVSELLDYLDVYRARHLCRDYNFGCKPATSYYDVLCRIADQDYLETGLHKGERALLRNRQFVCDFLVNGLKRVYPNINTMNLLAYCYQQDSSRLRSDVFERRLKKVKWEGIYTPPTELELSGHFTES